MRAAWAEELAAGAAFRIEGGRTTSAFSSLADEYLEGRWRGDSERRARVREVIGEAVTPAEPSEDSPDAGPRGR